ncbi:MAG: DHH family phosphoesterase [Clostridia bacterium]
MNKKWQIYDTNQEKIEEIESKYNLNKLLATILVNRNIITKKDIELFLNPTRQDFYDPFLIKDMDIAIKRIIKAIENKEKVTIYGDYDVDGITSITVLKSFLKDVGLEAKHYIPNRLKRRIWTKQTSNRKNCTRRFDLMITVDCGISGNEEIEYANSLGIETIITDHHEPGNKLPKALAVIDNKEKTLNIHLEN